MKRKETTKDKKILFITRVFPPQVGGMERLSYNIINKIKEFTEIYTIVNYKGKKFLPFFIIYAFFKSLFIARKVDCIHLSDPTLAVIGFVLRILYRKPVVYNVHGLDLLYSNKIYQLYLNFFLKPDKLICISYFTEAMAKKLGYHKTVIIPLGINPADYSHDKIVSLKDVARKFKFPQQGKRLLITVGRLVKRKGIAWFIESVLPFLPEEVIYIVVGEGGDRKRILEIIDKKGLINRVFLLGEIEQIYLDSLNKQADLFIMPNIPVENDAEGFGFVAIEAAAWRLPVVAANIEGITDAIINEKNGILVESRNSEAFIKSINSFLRDDRYRAEFGSKARQFTLSNYNWDTIIQQYYKELTNL